VLLVTGHNILQLRKMLLLLLLLLLLFSWHHAGTN
jgi:hypothetical protein